MLAIYGGSMGFLYFMGKGMSRKIYPRAGEEGWKRFLPNHLPLWVTDPAPGLLENKLCYRRVQKGIYIVKPDLVCRIEWLYQWSIIYLAKREVNTLLHNKQKIFQSICPLLLVKEPYFGSFWVLRVIFKRLVTQELTFHAFIFHAWLLKCIEIL